MKRLWPLALALLGSAAAASPQNTLILQQATDVVTLDPTQSYDTSSGTVLENLYETLVGYKGKSANELTGVLATDWKISGDAKQYTFSLRKNVRFHSGNIFTCEDAEYSLRRDLVTNNPQSGNWFLSESLLGTGANASDDKNITWAKIANAVRCNAQGQLVLSLPKADPALLAKLSYTSNSVVDKKWAVNLGEWNGSEKSWRDWVGKDLSASALAGKPSGSGAYKVVRKDANNYVFQAFEGYWGGKPKLEYVLIQIVQERSTRLEALKKGDADFLLAEPRSVLGQLEGQNNVKVLDGIANTGAAAITMNQQIAEASILGSGKLDGNGIPANFFADASVRKGFAYALDYNRLIKEVLQGQGTQRSMMLPDSFFGYDPKVKKYSYDPKLAAAFLRKAWGGQVWEKGFKLVAHYRAGSQRDQMAMEMLKTNLERLNPRFRVDVQAKAWPDFIRDASRGKEAMIVLDWSPDYPDPDNFLYTFYHSEGSASTFVRFEDSVLDGFLEQARATTDPAKRQALYTQVGNRAYELSPYILLPMGYRFVAYNAALQGVNENFNPVLQGGLLWKNLSK